MPPALPTEANSNLDGMRTALRHALSSVAWCREVLRWEPVPWQVWILECPAKEVLALCSRQAGKSTVAAALALWIATMLPNALILIIAPAGRQSSELLLKVTEFLRLLPPTKQQDEGVKNASVLSIRFENGARIISLPGATPDTIRGYSNPQLIIADESGDLPDATYLAIRPMMARGNTKFIAIGTPKGRRGWFYEGFEHDDAGDFAKIKIAATDCDYITPARLATERRLMGDRMFRQEYLCEWIAGDEELFSSEDVQAAITDQISALKIYIGL